MKRIIFFLVLFLAAGLYGAIPAGTVWEIRTTGANTNGGGFVWTSLVSATYAWTASGSGTNEYYCRTAALGNPSLTASGSVCTDGNYNLATEGTVGSLTAGQYDWADNDGLGYTTLYVRLANGLDPDTMIARGQSGYVSYGGGGTDYSQQAAAQLSLADLTTDGAGTGLGSVTGGFTAAMKNNIIYITGGTLTAGWYQITAYTSSNLVTIDRSAGASKAGGTGKVGGAFAFGGVLDDDFGEAFVAGNTCWIGGGTHAALGETVACSISGGWNTGLIRTLGYQTTRGDNPTADNRPLIQCGANAFGPAGSQTLVAYLRLTGTGTGVFVSTGANNAYFNIKATNTADVIDAHAFSFTGTAIFVVGCEGICTNTGSATSCFSSGAVNENFIGCYASGGYYGFSGLSNLVRIILCAAKNAADTGIYATGTNNLIINNTIYNCPTGITSDLYSLVMNNIVDAATTGHDTDAAGDLSQFSFYNCIDATTAMSVIRQQFASNIFADPGLLDPANGNFRISSTSTNVYEQGVDVGTFTSAVTYEE